MDLELSDILLLLKLRPKALRFEKQLLISIHLRFQARIKQLIERNESKKNTPQETLTIEDIKNQVSGLFYLKKNTSILSKVLHFAYKLIIFQREATDFNNPGQIQSLKVSQQFFQEIIFTINQNLDDTIDIIRQAIAQFIKHNYNNKILAYNQQILRMLIKSKFYKNYPIVRNEDWIHQYVYQYLLRILDSSKNINIQEFISVLKSSVTYLAHCDPYSKDKFFTLIDKCYVIAKNNLLSLSYVGDNQQLRREINSISAMIKIIPSYLYLKHYHSISTINYTKGNKVDSTYIKLLIGQLQPLIKRFIIYYFDKVQSINEEGVEIVTFTKSIDENIQVLNSLIESQQNPQKLLLKSVENLLNIVTVFKDYELTDIDTDFVLLLIETEAIYCVLCRKYIADEVRFLRLIEHSVFVLGQLQRQLLENQSKYKKYQSRIKTIKKKMQQELAIYDNVEKTYKPFTVLRLVSTLKCIGLKPKFLGDFYKNVKFKKPNIYVETLSRTMLKGHNIREIIDAFQLVFQGKITVKEIQLGRIVFLSSKEPMLLKYWMHHNRQELVNKICFCRRIITNIVSIIRMDNLQINRNSIQILAEIIIENKLFEIRSPSVSNQQESSQLKRILCNNFSTLFRYSKMDSMLDDIFIVHKNVPTLFRNKFSHIEAMKILSFSSYLSEEQSIFFINRQNKNSLFKFVFMIMKKVPYCHRSKKHYLLDQGFREQSLFLDVVGKIIQQYWPDNKLTNKAMPFYSQFLAFYVRTNNFGLLIKSENTIFLIIKQILQDYKDNISLYTGNQTTPSHDHRRKSSSSIPQFRYIMSRWQDNYEILHYLSIFENEPNLENVVGHVMSSMSIPVDNKVFMKMRKYIEGVIDEEIKQQEMKESSNTSNMELLNDSSIQKFKKQYINKHLVNKLVMLKLNSLEQLNPYSQRQILSLLTIDILVHGAREIANENMKHILKKVLAINPLSVSISSSLPDSKIEYPFELFKLIISNINIYIANRQSHYNNGKQAIDSQISNQNICRWVIKSLLNYCKNIKNNEEIMEVMHYLSSWNIDLLKLIDSNLFNVKIDLINLGQSYVDVEILSLFFTQNLIHYNQNKSANLPVYSQFNNEHLIQYISIILIQFKETHLMNNYGVYFQTQGQKVLNIIRSLLILIHETEPMGSKLLKDTNELLKQVKQLFEQFYKLYNTTVKYNQLKNGNKHSFSHKNQGNASDMHKTHSKTQKSSYNTDLLDEMPVNIKLFSKFTEMVEIISIIKLNKWSSIQQFSSQHLQYINRINEQISKRQKGISLYLDVTYLIDVEKMIEIKEFNDIGLKLYVKKSEEYRKLTIFYFVSENHSLLYNYETKHRQRLTGEQQLTICYIESLVKISLPEKIEVETIVVPQGCGKEKLKKLIAN